jgi:polar amino acid transport system substrate-binding protein
MSARADPNRRRVFRWLASLALCLLHALPASQSAAQVAPAQAFIMGAVDDEASFPAKWYGRIYLEAFRRLGLRVELAVYPTQRIGALLDQGLIDGEVVRARIYADAHPELIRVDESVFDVTFALYAANGAVELKRLEDLAALKWRVGHRRGVLFCEKALAALPADRLVDVTRVDQGLMMLLSGRTDVFCDNDTSVASALDAAEFKGVTTIRPVLLLEVTPLYPYLHRRHAALAPRLAATLKLMKSEGLIERYRLEALREVGR